MYLTALLTKDKAWHGALYTVPPTLNTSKMKNGSKQTSGKLSEKFCLGAASTASPTESFSDFDASSEHDNTSDFVEQEESTGKSIGKPPRHSWSGPTIISRLPRRSTIKKSNRNMFIARWCFQKVLMTVLVLQWLMTEALSAMILMMTTCPSALRLPLP